MASNWLKRIPIVVDPTDAHENHRKMIEKATTKNVGEITRLYLNGYYQPTNKGVNFPIIPESVNSTEAIISYLNHTSFNLNKYIQLWEANRLSAYPAPGLHSSKRFISSYQDVCFSFLSLNGILESDNLITYCNTQLQEISIIFNHTVIQIDKSYHIFNKKFKSKDFKIS